MKLSRSNISSLLLVMACWLCCGGALARPYLRELNVRVVLSPNGDARITETRQMSIDSEGTECYIGLGNMGGSEVRDLTVSDESGRPFQNIG